MELRDLLQSIMSATSTADIKKLLTTATGVNHDQVSNSDSDTATSDGAKILNTQNPGDGPNSYGVKKQAGVSLNRLRKEANAAAIEVINRVGNDRSKLTAEDIAVLRKYSGIGGTDTVSDTGGHIHEYYTPPEIAEGVWDGLTAMGFSGGNGLEPSSGSGVFQATKPKGVLMTASEIDKTSSSVNQLLNPDDMVLNQPFEKLAAEVEDGTFDSCVGNVPFGVVRGETAHLDSDPASKEFSNIADYFVVRTIDKVKAGGLIGLVVPTRIISGKDTVKMRRLISRKAEFLGAHRLPSGVFSDSGTDVVTDIIFLRKHSDELAAKLPSLKDGDLKAANVLWDTFITGKWFDSSEGKRFVHGESERLSFQNKLVVNNTNALTNSDIKSRLSHKFESRIDWESLNSAEPLPITYAEGDEKLINGRWMNLVNGNWEPIKLASNDGSINAEKYGAESLAALEGLLSNPQGALSLTYDQLIAIHRDFPYMTKGPLSEFIALAYKQPAKYRAQIIRGSIIGMRVKDLQTDSDSDGSLLAEVRALVASEAEKYGVPANISKLSALSGKGANYWNAFAAATDKAGEFSALLKGELVKGGTIAFDTSDAAQTVGHLFAVRDLVPVPLDEFLAVYTGTATSVEELAEMEGLAITPDGLLAPIDRATSGDIVKTRARIIAAMANESSQSVLENYQRQLDLIEKKRTRTEVDSIDMTMNSKWVPRQYIMEFMKESGYADLTYSKVEEDEFGDQFENKNYLGDDGVFSGYNFRDGKKRSSANEQFERQIENYLNGTTVRSNTSAGTSAYKTRIKDLERDFAIWIRQHDDIDGIVNLYNDKFNGYIPIEHSGEPLGLESVSGDIVNFDYQCAEIRRLSESGGGICGFGTGLGKTATALGLIAYNTQLGRATRTPLVVPKSVLENWYHEAHSFYGASNMGNVLVIGIKPVLGKDGEPEREAVLDENGEPKLNRNTGQPVYRNKVKPQSAAEIKKALNLIPHSNYTTVIMSKETFASIPMRPESIGQYVSDMVDAGMLNGKYVKDAKKHKESLKNAKFKEKYADTGTTKKSDIPYFEDMAFDNVIVDEGHNYRNSYAAGRESGKLAYLPTQGSANMAVDLSAKTSIIKSKMGGRGVVMLTATPTVNSPTDIFNMLSHVMTLDQWGALGITDVDDFIRVFGETDEVPVQKLSGEVEVKTALVGFKNLSGLRGLFHKHVNLKTAKDVSASVAIPDLVEIEQECEMTEEQTAIYEELRERAEELNNITQEERAKLIEQGLPVDSAFRITREMDRVTTDIDLYKKQMTFVFPANKAEAINKLVADLPDSLKLKLVDDDKASDDKENIEKFEVEHNATVSMSGDQSVVLVVAKDYEIEVINRLSKFGINENEVSHPITPKYARLIENLKTGLESGKQIIFTEEKTQHQKLARIIVNHLGIERKEIGIINADTVSGKGDEQASLEGIATAYNEGRHRIIIANKKAEVGVNLHHGTTDIHNLTLPWTPASIKQRSGRGARVGSKQKKVNVHYYVGKGSFDEFRLRSLKRKAEWMNELFTSDLDRMENADVNDAEETSLLLAKDATEREARIAANKAKAEQAVRAAQKVRATINLNNYIKASHDLSSNPDEIQQRLNEATSNLETQTGKLESARKSLAIATEQLADGSSLSKSLYGDTARYRRKEVIDIGGQISVLKNDILKLTRQLERSQKAESQVKRLRPTIARSIEDGLLDIDKDVLDRGDQYIVVDGETFSVGKKYESPTFSKHSGRTDRIVQIESIDFAFKTVVAKLLYSSSQWGGDRLGMTGVFPISTLRNETEIADTEIKRLNHLVKAIPVVSVSKLLSKEDFYWAIDQEKLMLDVNGSGYSRSSYALKKDGDSFAISFVASSSSIDKDDAKDFVYPDTSDESLKKRLSKWILEDRKTRAEGYKTPTGFYEAILGKNWKVNIEAYGNSADSTQINVFIAKMAKEFLATEDGEAMINRLKENKYSSTSNWSSYVLKNIPIEYDNISEFEAAAELRADEFKLATAEEVEKDRATKIAGYRSAYKKADSAQESVKRERGQWVMGLSELGDRAAFEAFKEANAFSRKEAGEFWIGSALSALEYVTNEQSGINDLQWGQFTNRLKSMLLIAYRDRDEINARLNPAETDDSSDESNSDEALATLEKFRAEADEEASNQLKAISSKTVANGIIIKLNQSLINEPKKKVAGRRFWSKARYFEVGEVIAIHDPEGRGGIVAKRRELIKQLTEGVFFTENLNSEFEGGWWFVPADVTIDQVNEIIQD